MPLPSLIKISLFCSLAIAVGVRGEKMEGDQLEKGGHTAGGEQRCWSKGNGQSAQWLEEGDTVERGKFWYQCAGGKLRPAGCLDESARRVPLGETFVSSEYLLMECILWGGTPKLGAVGCSSAESGATYRVGQTWEDAEHKRWFECRWKGGRLRARLSGCVQPAGEEDGGVTKRLRIGERVDTGNYSYECQQRTAGAVEMHPVGCIVDGKRYRIGEQWQDGDFLFYCKRSGPKCLKACVGCVLDGRRLFDGDRVRRARSVLQCEIRPKRHSLSPVACVSEGGVERVADCQWTDQSKSGSYRIKRQCVVREGRADIDTLGCVFQKDGISRLTLRPGTYTVWRESMDREPVGVVCRGTEEEEHPLLETYPADQLQRVADGLQMDADPRM